MNAVVIPVKIWNKATLIRMWDNNGICTPAYVCCSKKHANEYADAAEYPARELMKIDVDQLPNGLICASCHEPVTPPDED